MDPSSSATCTAAGRRREEFKGIGSYYSSYCRRGVLRFATLQWRTFWAYIWLSLISHRVEKGLVQASTSIGLSLWSRALEDPQIVISGTKLDQRSLSQLCCLNPRELVIMKFGRSSLQHQIPQWRSQYIRYNALKKLFKGGCVGSHKPNADVDFSGQSLGICPAN
jgi:hypothetical protein